MSEWIGNCSSVCRELNDCEFRISDYAFSVVSQFEIRLWVGRRLSALGAMLVGRWREMVGRSQA
jgi:hypothetical protein